MLKFVKTAALYTLAVVLIAVVCGYAWLATGPKFDSLIAKVISRHLVQIIKEKCDHLDINVGKTSIGLTNYYQIALNLTDLQFSLNGAPTLVNEIGIRFDPIGLIPFTTHSLVNVNVILSEEYFNAATHMGDGGTINALFSHLFIEDSLNHKHLEDILSDITITIPAFGQHRIVQLSHFALSPVSGDSKELNIDVRCRIDQNPVVINLSYDSKSKRYKFSMTIKAFNYAMFGVDQDVFSDIQHAKFSFDLLVHGSCSAGASIKNCDVHILGKNITIQSKNRMSEPVNLDEITVDYQHSENGTSHITNMNITRGTKSITGNASITNGVVFFKCNMSPLILEDVFNFWPIDLGTNIRSWLKEYVKAINTDAITIDGVAHIGTTNTSAGRLSVVIPIQQATLQIPTHGPSIQGITGDINITEEKVSINVSSANVLQSSLKDFKVDITSLTKSPVLTLEGSMSGPVQDAVDLAFSYAEADNKRLHDFSGAAQSLVRLTVPLHKDDLAIEDFVIDVQSTLENVKVSKLYDRFTISNGKFDVQYTNGTVNLTGTGLYEGLFPVTIAHKSNITSSAKDGMTTVQTGPMTHSKAALLKAGYKVPTVILGNTISFEATARMDHEERLELDLKFDLKKNHIDIPGLGIPKKTGQPSSLSLTVKEQIDQNGQTEYLIKQYQLALGQFTSNGIGTVDRNLTLRELRSKDSSINNSTFEFSYFESDTDRTLNVAGNVVNLATVNFGRLFQNSDTNGKPLTINVKIPALKLKNDTMLYNFLFLAQSDRTGFKKIESSAKFGSGETVQLTGHYPSFTISSGNAGRLLQALGISSNIAGGALKLFGTYDMQYNINANLQITKYTIKNAPAFAKLLSLTSITTATGIFNMLQGKGIFFDKLACNFKYLNNAIVFDDCTQNGPTLMIRISGKIDFKTQKLKMSGLLVPANIINSLMSALPFWGTNFIATSFTVDGGLQDDPKISVNPLSIIALGPLRKLFAPERNLY
ncbi:hypothetical protein EDM53_00730 [Rickettsiales endosymbiont of Peranema trichophorum]|uniref:YhdP family protein n=1 Tax=Rickettsiales endosymbiont of Peranema trichophorum TaxID=2486577 RepID=UPI001022C659|nr:AsmA-like C-terminal domain-containing protein [Rickettsiales endosymbiont of Peranema trichophorum]RZI47680.1 hypothetical protein EDM53_00730 [Rickettsiales endosymbiont of Peranema trichophorum]